jgi:hypothetical protein
LASPVSPNLPSSRSGRLSRLLTLLSAALLVGFAAAMVVVMIPPRLLAADWQWRFSGALIDNGPAALVGLGLLHLAAYLDARNTRLKDCVSGLHRWAAAAAVGFLLLIPLQVVAGVRGLSNASLNEKRQLGQLDQRLAEVRQAIRTAPDLASLQRRIPPEVASSLGPLALQQPLPQLKAQLLTLLDQTQQQFAARLSAPRTSRLWTVIERSLRVVISAPAYAVAFAAMSVRKVSEPSLLDQLLLSWGRWRRRRGRRSASASR